MMEAGQYMWKVLSNSWAKKKIILSIKFFKFTKFIIIFNEKYAKFTRKMLKLKLDYDIIITINPKKRNYYTFWFEFSV